MEASKWLHNPYHIEVPKAQLNAQPLLHHSCRGGSHAYITVTVSQGPQGRPLPYRGPQSAEDRNARPLLHHSCQGGEDSHAYITVTVSEGPQGRVDLNSAGNGTVRDI